MLKHYFVTPLLCIVVDSFLPYFPFPTIPSKILTRFIKKYICSNSKNPDRHPTTTINVVGLANAGIGSHQSGKLSPRAIKEAADRTVVEIELPRQQAKGCLNTTLKMTYFRDGFMKYVEKRVFSYWGFVASGLDRQF
ncbi:unnamed protein product [Lactuca virosa]|uniref:Uncharacterized protein n=1 Tax=Lactuca virosa TaxID=75947 RepID=A0AAU9PJA3_9ASTR|nr:unnamed protein product [Lactuca virosa]